MATKKQVKKASVKMFDASAYVGAHWMRFMLQALVAVVFGAICLFAAENVLEILVGTLAAGLFIFGVFELGRAAVQHHKNMPFGLALVSGGLMTILGVWLFVNRNGQAVDVLAMIVAVVAIVRGLFDLAIAIRGVKDSSDRFIWFTAGLLGVALGILIFFVPQFGWNASIAFVWIFGIYLLIKGLSNAFYAVHLRNMVSGMAARASGNATKKSTGTAKSAKSSAGGKSGKKK